MEIDRLKQRIASTRNELIQHPIFSWPQQIADVQTLMETHVWAVWDFMVLLKALQRELTCVDVLWRPKGNPALRRLINEIVWGEESDVDQGGRAVSHFELYVEAMEQIGANTGPIKSFIADLEAGTPVREALARSGAPEGAKAFVAYTLGVVESGDAAKMAAVFTYGREDLIPDMFIEMVRELKRQFPQELDLFVYYLERHIEIDGDEHGALAERMVLELCGEDAAKWERATEAAQSALQARIALWDSVMPVSKADREWLETAR